MAYDVLPEAMFFIGNHTVHQNVFTDLLMKPDQIVPAFERGPLDNCNYTFNTHTHKSDGMRIKPSVPASISLRHDKCCEEIPLVSYEKSDAAQRRNLGSGQLLAVPHAGHDLLIFAAASRPHLRNSTDPLKIMKLRFSNLFFRITFLISYPAYCLPAISLRFF